MKDNEHVLHNDFDGYDCFGDACRKRRHGDNRRQSTRSAHAEVRKNLLGLFDRLRFVLPSLRVARQRREEGTLRMHALLRGLC